MLALKEKILHNASALMGQFGISTVTMDDIAKDCHISKRTLYEQIPDKRTLVWQCMLHRHNQHEIEAKTLVYESTDTLDALLHIYKYMRNGMSNASSVFFKDLHRIYPDLEKKYREIHQEQSKFFANFLLKGVDEGVFLRNLNFPLATKAFLAQSSTILQEFATTADPEEMLRMVDVAFIIFLRGIATRRGIEIIDSYLKENNVTL